MNLYKQQINGESLQQKCLVANENIKVNLIISKVGDRS